MINTAFRILLTFNATSLLVIIFLVQKGYTLGHFFAEVPWLSWTVTIPKQADLHASVQWAEQQNRRWAFTLSNAGSRFFEDRNDLAQLHELNWQAIAATQWQNDKEGKQAEFLMAQSFPWHLVEVIGVRSPAIQQQVSNILKNATHKPTVTINPEWYY